MKIIYSTKTDMKYLEGSFLTQSDYQTLIEDDCDVYLDDVAGSATSSEDNCILKFRKDWFTKEQQEGAYEGLRAAAKKSYNRGMAAGTKDRTDFKKDWVTPEQQYILANLSKLPDNDDFKVRWEDIKQWMVIAKDSTTDNSRTVWKRTVVKAKGFDFNIWLDSIVNGRKPNSAIKEDVDWITSTFISETAYANEVDSGIAGWFGRYPRIPYGRATSYTESNYERFQLAYPFLQNLARGFKELLPFRYENQKLCCDQLDSRFYVPETPFTTITVNKNFRTAAHYDDGDLASGFSNLTVVAKDKNYKGGYLVLPEIYSAVNVRPGDLLLVANHEYMHGNTPIEAPDVGELERISLVCYFREDMLDLGSYEYEQARYNFIETRRKNEQHPLWIPRWNGVSENWEQSEEWRDFLLSQPNGQQMIEIYNPELNRSSNVEDMLFG